MSKVEIVWELSQATEYGRGSHEGLFRSIETAQEHAETIVNKYRAWQESGDDTAADVDPVWPETIWYIHKDPDIGFEQFRGKYCLSSAFHLQKRELRD